MIVRHQRASALRASFRRLARYLRGKEHRSRATWFLARNLPGVAHPEDLELGCHLVEAVQAQNTRARNGRTYHLVIAFHPKDRSLASKELEHIVENLVDTLGFSEHQYVAVRHNDKDHEHLHVAINQIHPQTFRIHSPAWDHQRLFTGARALENKLGLTPLRCKERHRERVPHRAADLEAHQGVESFAQWARENVRPALRARELRSWEQLHEVCGRLGVVIRPHGNGLVFEDVERGVRVKASYVGRDLSKARLCRQFGDFRPASDRYLDAARRATERYSPKPWRASPSLWQEYEQALVQARLRRQRAWSDYRRKAARERQLLKRKYKSQRHLLSALPVSGLDRKRLFDQLKLRQTHQNHALKKKLATERRSIERTPHPGTWRHFLASQAAERDHRVIWLVRGRGRERGEGDFDLGR